jgi:hypothetical protein
MELTSKQKYRIRKELAQDEFLESTTELSFLDRMPEIVWTNEEELIKQEIVREVIINAIEDCVRVRSHDRLDSLELFFNDEQRINNQTYPSLFHLYATYLGHDSNWINRAKFYCMKQIEIAKASVNRLSVKKDAELVLS